MVFIQIIDVTTSRPGELQELVEEWSAKTEGRRTAYRATSAADREGRTPTFRSWRPPPAEKQ